MARTLSSMNITYGEGAALESHAAFLSWMSKEGETVPATRKELNALLCRWLVHDRAEKIHKPSCASLSVWHHCHHG